MDKNYKEPSPLTIHLTKHNLSSKWQIFCTESYNVWSSSGIDFRATSLFYFISDLPDCPEHPTALLFADDTILQRLVNQLRRNM